MSPNWNSHTPSSPTCRPAAPRSAARHLSDEAILAAALRLSGYRHAIATLWTITDRTAADVTATMYTSLPGPSGLRLDDTARLLHHTTRALRDSAPRNPTVWAPYIHTGP